MDLPEIVYKYRSWSDKYHKNLLNKNQLYLSSPELFNDPFDCVIPVDYSQLDTMDKIIEYADQVIGRQKSKLIAAGKDPKHEKERIIKRLNEDQIGFQIQYEENQTRYRNKFYGVLALSTRWDSILMWSHYGDFHRGYCVGFHKTKLREAGKFGTGGNIVYNDNMPRIDPRKAFDMESYFLETYYKSEDWSYEREYRLTKNLFNNLSRDARIITIPDDCFFEIILGLNISDYDKEKIVSIARKKRIPIYQASKVPFKFRIERTEVL